VIPALDDLPPAQQAWVRRQIDKARDLSARQAERLQQLFWGSADDA
jgi:hypothetical protein